MSLEQGARPPKEVEEGFAIGVSHECAASGFGAHPCRRPRTPVVYNSEVFWKLAFTALRLLHMVSPRDSGPRLRVAVRFT